LIGNYQFLSLERLLRVISLAHWTTKCPFALAQKQNLLALGNRIRVFSALRWGIMREALGGQICGSQM